MGVGREQAGLTFARDQHDRYGDHVRVDFQGVGRTDEVVARRGRHHRGQCRRRPERRARPQNLNSTPKNGIMGSCGT